MPGTSAYPEYSIYPEEAQAKSGLFAPKRLLRKIVTLSLDLVFPPRCAGCGRVDWNWCDRCQHELEQTPFTPHVRPLPPLAGMASTALHAGIVQRMIWSLKYENARLLAHPLGQRLAQHLLSLNWSCDLIVPVPMHKSRLAERGYNQAQLLAEYAAAQVETPCLPTALVRERFTPSQVGLGRAQRLENVKDAFLGNVQLVAGRSILLVDDVYTTGATLSACAEAALAAGAQAVYGLTVSAARI